MSQQFPSAPSSDIQSLFKSTLDDYEKRTGINLVHHQLTVNLNSCGTADSIISAIRNHIQTLNNFRVEDGAPVIKWLKRIVRHLNTLSTNGVLGREGTLLFPLENAILAAFGVLLSAIDDTQVSTNYEMLIDLFRSVESFLKRLTTCIKIPPTTAANKVVVKILLELLSTLALAIQQVKEGSLGKLGERLLGESDVETVLQNLGQVGQQGTRTAAAQTLEIIHGLVQNMKTLIDDGKASTDDIQYALVIVQRLASDIIDKSKRDQSLKDVRTWLSPSDPSKSHNIAREVYHTGTGTWFIQGNTFTEWKNTGSLLWIHGKPGSGKTVLCSTVIEEIIRMREAGMALARLAYFYFDRKNTEKQDARALVSSLLVQLSEQSELYSDILSCLYSTHAAGSRQPGYNALLECLKDMLFVPGEGPIYIILDGLNESPRSPGTPSARESVLKVVEWLVNLGHPHLHICVSSHMEADVQVALPPLASQTVCLHEESGHIDDINYYIDFFINSDANTRRWIEEDRKMVINKISEEADGMFLWASCRLDYLRRCLPGGIERTLDELPEAMEVEYERILLDIDEKKWEAARLLFQCIAVAPRPLHVSELAEFFAFDFKPGQLPNFKAGWRPKDPEYVILSTCSSLISIVDANGSRVVQFSHFSVKQYLTSNNLARAGGRVSRHYFSVEDAQTTVAQGCLATLFQFDEHVNKSSVAKFPLAIYAARYLVIHASSPSVQLHIVKALERLLAPDKPHFAIWVWIYDVDENSGQSMTSETPPKPLATPLYYASQFGLIHTVRWLIYRFPMVIGKFAGYYGTPLIAASAKGHSDIATELILRGERPRLECSDGRTALYSASENGHLEIVKVLLAQYPPLDIFFMRQYSPLGQALCKGHLEIAGLLLQHGARVDLQNSLGETVLHQASKGGYDPASIKMLLMYNANTRSKDASGKTPLEIARESGHEEIARLLWEHDA